MINNQLEALDTIRLNFSPESLHMLNIALAVIMFGVALEIKLHHFKKIVSEPKSVIVGFISQFFTIPGQLQLLNQSTNAWAQFF